MSSVRKCDVCGKSGKKASNSVCECCKKNFCGKKHLKSHKKGCFPSTEDLSTEEVEHIETLAKDLEEASLETFYATLKELSEWDFEETEAKQDSDQKKERLHDPKRSVFLRAEGGPAFVRALEKHHAQLCERDHFNSIVLLGVMSKINEDVLSSIVEADVCSVVVKCIRTCQFNDVCQSLDYQRTICGMFHNWLLQMPGSTAMRKELIESDAIKIIIQWLEECFTGEEKVSAKTFLLDRRVKIDALAFLYRFSAHNFVCKTMLIETGGLRAVAAVIRANWGDPDILLPCKELLESLYCRCQQCTESIFCNLCGIKAKLACPCSTVRYCSEECQRKDWKSHKTLCKDSRDIAGTEIVDNTYDEYQVLKETGTIDPDDASLRSVDVVERLRSALSVDDVMRWLLVLSRVPYEEMLQCDGFAAVVHSIKKYEDVAEIQSRGCAVIVLFNQELAVLDNTVTFAVVKADGFRTILEAMKKHPYDTKLQGSACDALVKCCQLRTPDGRPYMEAAHAIIGAMMRHNDDFSVQEGGCGALWNLAIGHAEDKKDLVMAGAARVVAAASKTFWGRSAELDLRTSNFFTALLKEGYTEFNPTEEQLIYL